MNWVPALAPLEKYSLSTWQRNLQGISVVSFHEQYGSVFCQSLHQSKSALRTASGKIPAAKHSVAALCVPHFMGLPPTLYTALICKAYSIKGFPFVFSTISLNMRLLPLFFFVFFFKGERWGINHINESEKSYKTFPSGPC